MANEYHVRMVVRIKAVVEADDAEDVPKVLAMALTDGLIKLGAGLKGRPEAVAEFEGSVSPLSEEQSKVPDDAAEGQPN